MEIEVGHGVGLPLRQDLPIPALSVPETPAGCCRSDRGRLFLLALDFDAREMVDPIFRPPGRVHDGSGYETPFFRFFRFL
jgi:hypothetical protein